MVASAPVTKNLVIAALVGVIAIGGALVYAQASRTADVEVRVWESTSDPERNYISARPAGGSWSTLGTIPLGRGDASAYATTSNGRFRYSDITLGVPLPEGASALPTMPSPVSSIFLRFTTNNRGRINGSIATRSESEDSLPAYTLNVYVSFPGGGTVRYCQSKPLAPTPAAEYDRALAGSLRAFHPEGELRCGASWFREYGAHHIRSVHISARDGLDVWTCDKRSQGDSDARNNEGAFSVYTCQIFIGDESDAMVRTFRDQIAVYFTTGQRGFTTGQRGSPEGWIMILQEPDFRSRALRSLDLGVAFSLDVHVTLSGGGTVRYCQNAGLMTRVGGGLIAASPGWIQCNGFNSGDYKINDIRDVVVSARDSSAVFHCELRGAGAAFSEDAFSVWSC